ncbi:hypothetical protein VTO42DRAFT_7084 [Malbranchea cinnamomea]
MAIPMTLAGTTAQATPPTSGFNPAAVLRVIYGNALRPSEMLDRALDTLLLDMLSTLWPTELSSLTATEEITQFASSISEAQLRTREVPEKYWWHLKNLPKKQDIERASSAHKPGEEIALILSTSRCREAYHYEEWAEAVQMTYGKSIDELVAQFQVDWGGMEKT